MPFRASMLAFLVLQLAVLDDQREELVGERNGLRGTWPQLLLGRRRGALGTSVHD
jgi:hypothetical protein